MNSEALSRIVTKGALGFDFTGAATHIAQAEVRNTSEVRGKMPSLIRFLVTIGILVGIVYAGMWSLVYYVQPTPREMQVRIPSDKINPDF
jgi:hypothetical protein